MVFSGHGECLKPAFSWWEGEFLWCFLHHWRSFLSSSFMKAKVSSHFSLFPWWSLNNSGGLEAFFYGLHLVQRKPILGFQAVLRSESSTAMFRPGLHVPKVSRWSIQTLVGDELENSLMCHGLSRSTTQLHGMAIEDKVTITVSSQLSKGLSSLFLPLCFSILTLLYPPVRRSNVEKPILPYIIPHRWPSKFFLMLYDVKKHWSQDNRH